MKKPKLSIIIPAYNAENTIERCINSICGQSFRDFEIIIINDGSEDQTVEKCKCLAVSDDRIRILTQDNQGVSAARNKGIMNAIGEYLMFVDGDDAIEPYYVEPYINAVESCNADIVIGGLTKVYSNFGEREDAVIPTVGPGEYGKDVFWNAVCTDSEPYGYLVNKIFKSDIIKEHHLLLRTDMFSQEDLNFCLSYYEYCDSYTVISEVGYKYFFSEGKRTPPVHHYIENQLKLIHIAEKQANVTKESRLTVRKKIILWIFSLFYHAENRNAFRKSVNTLNSIKGLKEYLATVSGSGEKVLVSKLYYKKRYHMIYQYFMLRRVVKKGKRVFRK